MPKGTPDKGYALTPQREKVLRILATEGPLDDESGQVVSRLKERTGHESTQSLSMVIKSLADAGLIKREVIGRRTYHLELRPEALAPEHRERLGLDGAAPAPIEEAPEPIEPAAQSDLYDEPDQDGTDERAAGTDYRRLADELLKAASEVLARKQGDPKLKLRVAELEEQLAKERVRLDDLAAQLLQRGNELLEAKEMIRTLEHNLETVRKQHSKQKAERGSDPIGKRLTDRERRELEDLRRTMESRPGA